RSRRRVGAPPSSPLAPGAPPPYTGALTSSPLAAWTPAAQQENDPMYIVGLTGGIGSGKSAVAERFRALGILVVDADQAARAVVEPGTPALAAIAEHFGSGVIQADGGLDRAALRKLVFDDADQRRWLEQLLHPR